MHFLTKASLLALTIGVAVQLFSFFSSFKSIPRMSMDRTMYILKNNLNGINQVVAKAVHFDWKERIESGAITSLPGTTGEGVPSKIREWLLTTGIPIDENAKDFFGSEKAVLHMEENICGGWNADEIGLNNPDCTNFLGFGPYQETPSVLPDPNEIDIVVPSIRNLDFLEEWREFFQGFHVIIIQDGDQQKHLEIPEWVDYELHKRVDIERALGEGHWIISQRDASIRNFGFLVSKKRYVYTIDDDCRPAYDSKGHKINPLAFHYRNLKTPSTPFMFNTLYDPYQDGSDFVRGYPYSLRAGVPTGVSHGLWMNQPDYDAPTQLLKLNERVSQMHETVLTVPAGIFFPLCSMNVAFDRELIGPAMMQGLMGDGQPWARYDDMFSGWAAKSVSDHLGLGIKSGMPYIKHNKASNPFVNLRKEYLGLWWQEMILRFFMEEVQYSSQANTPSRAYKELANQIRNKFSGIHEYFNRLASAMEMWTDFWDLATKDKIIFTPSRQFQSQLEPINRNYVSFKSYGNGPMLNLRGVDDMQMKQDSILKIYVYDLPYKYSLENFLKIHKAINDPGKPKSNCNWNMNVCHEEKWEDEYSTMRQYGGDVILIQKFRRYPNRVYEPDDADIFVVPYPHSSMCRDYITQGWSQCNYGKGLNSFRDINSQNGVEAMLSGLEHLNEETKKRHLFLLSGDTENHFKVFTSMPLYVSLGGQDFPGSKNIVMPPPNTEPMYQPSVLSQFDWTKPRKIAAFMHVGLVSQIRKQAFKLLQDAGDIGGLPVEVHEIQGHRKFTISVQDTWKKYGESYFCPVLEGDLPYQKRFYDVILAGCIPVVVAFPSIGNNPHRSWWKPNWLGYNITHPFASSIDYSEFVVELDKIDDIVPTLEALIQNKTKIQQMQSALGKAAPKFVYGLDDDIDYPNDAFGEILRELGEYVSGLNH